MQCLGRWDSEIIAQRMWKNKREGGEGGSGKGREVQREKEREGETVLIEKKICELFLRSGGYIIALFKCN